MMRSEYLVCWGDGETFRCDSIQSVVGHLLLQFMRGYSEVTVRIVRAM